MQSNIYTITYLDHMFMIMWNHIFGPTFYPKIGVELKIKCIRLHRFHYKGSRGLVEPYIGSS